MWYFTAQTGNDAAKTKWLYWLWQDIGWLEATANCIEGIRPQWYMIKIDNIGSLHLR